MPNILKTIGKQVEQAQLILADTQDQEVKNKMAQYNVGPEELVEGQNENCWGLSPLIPGLSRYLFSSRKS